MDTFGAAERTMLFHSFLSPWREALLSDERESCSLSSSFAPLPLLHAYRRTYRIHYLFSELVFLKVIWWVGAGVSKV